MDRNIDIWNEHDNEVLDRTEAPSLIVGEEGIRVTSKPFRHETQRNPPFNQPQGLDQAQVTACAADRCRDDIREMVARLLMVDPRTIDVNEDIRDYGFDPFNFAVLAGLMNERYQLELTPDLIAMHATVGALYRYTQVHARPDALPAVQPSVLNGATARDPVAYTLNIAETPIEWHMTVTPLGVQITGEQETPQDDRENLEICYG